MTRIVWESRRKRNGNDRYRSFWRRRKARSEAELPLEAPYLHLCTHRLHRHESVGNRHASFPLQHVGILAVSGRADLYHRLVRRHERASSRFEAGYRQHRRSTLDARHLDHLPRAVRSRSSRHSVLGDVRHHGIPDADGTLRISGGYRLPHQRSDAQAYNRHQFLVQQQRPVIRFVHARHAPLPHGSGAFVYIEKAP